MCPYGRVFLMSILYGQFLQPSASASLEDCALSFLPSGLSEGKEVKIAEETSQKIKNMSILCTVFVVSIHIGLPESLDSSTWFLTQLIPNGIANIAVPFFYVVSGFFLALHIGESGWWKRENRKRLFSLLIPLYVCTAIYVLAAVPLSIYADIIAHRPFGTSIFFLHGTSWIELTNLDLTDYPHVGPLWYVRNLLILVFISPIVDALVRRLSYCWLALCFVGILFVNHLPLDPKNVFFTHGFSFTALFYFSVGLFICHKKFSQPTQFTGIACGIIGIALLSARIFCFYHNLHFYSSFDKISLPFLMIATWCFMPTGKWPIWLTSSSFAIYLLHELFFVHIDLITKHLPNVDPLSPTRAIVKFVVGFVGSIVLTIILRRFLPKTSKVLFGGR